MSGIWEKTRTRKQVYDGAIIKVCRDTAETSDGQIVDRELVQHPGGVGIALEDEEGKFFLVKQWRYAQETETIEFPAGKKEKGEDPLTTAMREVIEETGFEGTDWMYLGEMYPTPAYDTEVITLYYAKQGKYVGQHLDADENIRLQKMSLQELTDAVFSGKIKDAKTMGMTFLIKEMKERGHK